MLRYILLRGILGFSVPLFAILTLWDRYDDGQWPTAGKLVRSLVIWSLAGIWIGYSGYRRMRLRVEAAARSARTSALP